MDKQKYIKNTIGDYGIIEINHVFFNNTCWKKKKDTRVNAKGW